MRYAAILLVTLLIGCGPSLESRKEYVRNHDRPTYIENAIISEEVTTGMTKSDVKVSLGDPDSVNQSYYQGVGARTQWCYDGGGMLCIYFEEGTVTGWN